MSFGRELIERLGGWANELAVPLMPPRVVSEGDDRHRLEFRQHNPHAVMVGKLIRAVSGLHGALFLAEAGYVAECGTSWTLPSRGNGRMSRPNPGEAFGSLGPSEHRDKDT